MNAGSAMATSHERETTRLTEARAGVFADRGLRRAALAGLAWLVFYAAATALTADAPRARTFLGDIVYLLPVALATWLSLRVARRATGRRRRFWTLLVASNSFWLAGDLVWAGYEYVLRRESPFPSIADGLYLTSYIIVPFAVLAGFGSSSGRRRARALLDAMVVALGVGALGWHLLIAPQVDGGLSPATLTGIAYPLLGVAIVITLLSVTFAGHRHVAPSVWLVGAAFLVTAATDAGYTYFSSLHEYVSGDWLNLGWQLEAVLLCIAAYAARRHQEGDGQTVTLARDLAMVPVLVGVACALVLVALVGADHAMPVTSLVVAGAVVTGLVARFLLSVADTRRVAQELDEALHEQERLAVTDGLTGLYNRRFFEEVLRLEADRAVREGRGLALLVADLDHFKRINDSHGHPAGDAVLLEASIRLQRALRDSDVLARYGGEEFVVILPGADARSAREAAERCRRALGLSEIVLHGGTRVTVTASFGLACYPGDTPDVGDLVRFADRALYAAKESGRDRVVAVADAGPVTPTAGPVEAYSSAGPSGDSEPRVDRI